MNVQGNVSVLLICSVAAAVCYADPFSIAREIEGDLAALELQGMDGRAAINRMMAEGYRCGLEEGTALAPGLPAPASVVCSIETRQWETECTTLDVTMLL